MLSQRFKPEVSTLNMKEDIAIWKMSRDLVTWPGRREGPLSHLNHQARHAYAFQRFKPECLYVEYKGRYSHMKFTYIQDHLKFTYIQDHLKFTYIQDHFVLTNQIHKKRGGLANQNPAFFCYNI